MRYTASSIKILSILYQSLLCKDTPGKLCGCKSSRVVRVDIVHIVVARVQIQGAKGTSRLASSLGHGILIRRTLLGFQLCNLAFQVDFSSDQSLP